MVAATTASPPIAVSPPNAEVPMPSRETTAPRVPIDFCSAALTLIGPPRSHQASLAAPGGGAIRARGGPSRSWRTCALARDVVHVDVGARIDRRARDADDFPIFHDRVPRRKRA